jgi:hypothetical protein
MPRRLLNVVFGLIGHHYVVVALTPHVMQPITATECMQMRLALFRLRCHTKRTMSWQCRLARLLLVHIDSSQIGGSSEHGLRYYTGRH